MDDWISQAEAIARVHIRFPSLPDAEDVVLDAIAHERIRVNDVQAFSKEVVATAEAVSGGQVNLQASGITWVDREYDEMFARARRPEVSLSSLIAWMNNLAGDDSPRQPANVVEEKPPRKTKYDWGAYQMAYVNRVAELGEPSLLNVDGWQDQADVARWIIGLVAEDWGGVEPSEATAKRAARRFMRIRVHEGS